MHSFLFEGNYLYADSFDFKNPGTPLIYNTRHFPPSKKCLQFWYYMDAVGDATLSVNLYQKGNAASEILKISGDQGANWKRATVNLAGYLSEEHMLFNVSVRKWKYRLMIFILATTTTTLATSLFVVLTRTHRFTNADI